MPPIPVVPPDEPAEGVPCPHLPTDVWLKIFDHLGLENRLQNSTVCAYWRMLIQQTTTNATFEEKFQPGLADKRIQWLNGMSPQSAHRLKHLVFPGRDICDEGVSPGLQLQKFTGLETLRLHIHFNGDIKYLRPPTFSQLSCLQAMPDLQNLSISIVVGREETNLEPFAYCKKLDSLTLYLQSVSSRTWPSVRLAPQYTGLSTLRKLTLHGEFSDIAQSEGLEHVLQKLETLDLCATVQYYSYSQKDKAIHAPVLRSLALEHTSLCNPRVSTAVEIRTGDLLTDLKVRHPSPVKYLSTGLRSLEISGLPVRGRHGAYNEIYTREDCSIFLAQFAKLTNLTALKTHPFHQKPQSFLHAFTCITSLNCLNISGRAESRESPGRYDSVELLGRDEDMASLDSLELCGVPQKVHMDSLALLSALKRLHISRTRVAGQMRSKTLEYANIECLPSETVHLGQLPKIKTLELRLQEEQDISDLASRLAEMPLLQVLRIFVGSSFSLKPVSIPRERSCCSKVLPSVFPALRGHQFLTSVTVVDKWGEYALRRKDIPALKELNLICSRLSICATCLPWKESVRLSWTSWTAPDLETAEWRKLQEHTSIDIHKRGLPGGYGVTAEYKIEETM